MLKQQMVRLLVKLAQNQPLQISPLINIPRLKPLVPLLEESRNLADFTSLKSEPSNIKFFIFLIKG